MKFPHVPKIHCRFAIPILDLKTSWILISLVKEEADRWYSLKVGHIIDFHIKHGIGPNGQTWCHTNCEPPLMVTFSATVSDFKIGNNASEVLGSITDIDKVFEGQSNVAECMVTMKSLGQDVNSPLIAIQLKI